MKNYIPVQPRETGSYMCTWGLQAAAARQYGIEGAFGANVRDALTLEYLFEEDSIYHWLPRALRGDLYFVLDDGWDVPPHTENRSDVRIRPFGAVEPDPARFASLGDTPVERLTALNRLAKEWGYAGLGLWISPQIPMEDAEIAASEALAHWKERAIWCQQAGVRYWKVDWGVHDGDMTYRRMMTEVVKTYAPDVAIEHACVQMPLTQLGDAEKRRRLSREMFAFSDFFRTYDVVWPLADSCTLARAHEVLCDPLPFEMGTKGILSMECQALAAAGLGGALGVMVPDIASHAVLRWQRLAPPFGAAESDYRYSEEMLTDSYMCPKDLVSWIHTGGMCISETAPAVMARGCALPCVQPVSGEKPYVTASRHPETGAYAIAAIRRCIGPNPMIIAPAHVTWQLDDADAVVGIFGYMETLTLVYPKALPKGCRVYAQNLLDDAAQEITDDVVAEGNRLTLDSRIMGQIGVCNYAYGEMMNGPMTDPMLLIKIEMP